MIEKDYGSVKMLFDKPVVTDPIKNSGLSPYVAANPIGDWITVSYGLRLVLEKFKDVEELKVAEVGTAHGHFVYSMATFLRTEKKVDAYGVDSRLHGYDPRFFGEPGMTFVEGKSSDSEVLDRLGGDFHFLFIDACHCWKHVAEDLSLYHSKVIDGGFLGLHDTHPLFQGGTPQPRTPDCSADVSIGVVKGISKFGASKHNFRLAVEGRPLDKNFGGVRIYESVKP